MGGIKPGASIQPILGSLGGVWGNPPRTLNWGKVGKIRTSTASSPHKRKGPKKKRIRVVLATLGKKGSDDRRRGRESTVE